MIKKKSSLWLHRPKRRSLPRHSFFSQLCRKLPPEILNDLYESSQQSGRKHKCTPLKGSTTKRKRLLSPGTPSSTGLSSPRQCPFSPLSTSYSNSDLETVKFLTN